MSNNKEFGARHLTSCRICGGDVLVDYLDLGDQPPANSFLAPDKVNTEKLFPLKIALCRTCGLSQLLDVVSAEDIFDDYLYRPPRRRRCAIITVGLLMPPLNGSVSPTAH